jgi:iron complex transport system permease protein
MTDNYLAARKHEITIRRHLLVIFFILTIFTLFLALALGRYDVPLWQCFKIIIAKIFPFLPIQESWDDTMFNVVWNIRLPRTLAAMLVGAALSLSGITYQNVFHNPIVSPDILGVSSGACTGAAIALLNHSSAFGVEICALAGGLSAVLLSTLIPRLFRDTSTLFLVLSGVIVGGIMSSALGLCKYIADPTDELASIVYWTMGSFAYTKLKEVGLTTIPISICAAVLLALRWRIGIYSVDETKAKSLGMNVTAMRSVCILCATVMTACSVCICGTIGWVGLMVPHLARLIEGQDTRFSMPMSLLTGAIFMAVIDTLARNLSTGELPISILTGFIGAPLFLILLFRQRKAAQG